MPIGITKSLGIILTIFLLLVIGVGIYKGAKESYEIKSLVPVLKSTGGQIFAIETDIEENTDNLLKNDELSRGFLLDLIMNLFVLLIIFLLLFRFGLWISGSAQLNPLAQIFIFLIIFTIFGFLEFIYSFVILDKTIIPFYSTAKNLLLIVKNLL